MSDNADTMLEFVLGPGWVHAVVVEAASRLKSGVAAAESDWLLATGAEPLAR